MEKLDCLIIGHFEAGTNDLYAQLEKLGVQSGTYRDFNLGFVSRGNEKYSLSQIYNYYLTSMGANDKRIRENNTFNAAISYLGTYLSKAGLSFRYITSVREEAEEIKRIFEMYDVLSVAVLTTLYVTPNPIMEVVKIVKHYSPTTKIVVGGPYITTLCRTKDDDYIAYVCSNLLKADYYVNSSKGEESLRALVTAIKFGQPVDSIKNLFFINDGNIVRIEVSPENTALSENLVDWSLFSSDQKQFVNVRTAVSCPYACAFCGFPENAGKYQTVDPNLVINELDALVRFNPALKSIYFIDDTFNVPKARFKELLRLIIKKKYAFKWHSYFRCQHADEEAVTLMKESGCEGVFLGIESGSNTILKNMNKQSTVEHYERGIAWLKQAGIMTFGAFITGFPGETFKTIMETIRFIESSGLDFFRTQMWFCEHITPIWRQREQYGIKGEGFDWSHDTMDSKTATSFVEKLFLDVKNVTWLPQHDFDYENVFRLLHSGMSLEQIKALVAVFNESIRGKVRRPADKEMSDKHFTQIGEILHKTFSAAVAHENVY
jgi:anaerobic magnesium-protoporphyrin IX monomethyl ester cyclase